jgi:transcriptional regulator with XRE-family HTH domain
MSKNPLSDLGGTLGDYLREQRQSARMSLRQLSELAGVSNPYLSQIERGLKKPSAEILQQLAKGLEISAETLYVRAGILEDRGPGHEQTLGVLDAIEADPLLTRRQRDALIDIYTSFVAAAPPKAARTATTKKPSTPKKTTTITTKE